MLQKSAYKRVIRNHGLAKYDQLIRDLQSVDRSTNVSSMNNINAVFSNFTKIFYSCVTRAIPAKTVTICPDDKAFMNNDIRLTMH